MKEVCYLKGENVYTIKGCEKGKRENFLALELKWLSEPALIVASEFFS